MFQYLGLLSGLSTFTVAVVKNLLVVSGAATFINRRMRPYSQFPSDKIEGWSSGVTRKAGLKFKARRCSFTQAVGEMHVMGMRRWWEWRVPP